jgi:hypothetical protein
MAIATTTTTIRSVSSLASLVIGRSCVFSDRDQGDHDRGATSVAPDSLRLVNALATV